MRCASLHRLTSVPGSTLAVLLILALGAAMRFYNLGFIEYSYDNSYPAYDAVRMLDGKTVLLLGQPSSVFLDNPPLMSYLQAIPLFIWRSPWAVYLPIVALNTLAIVLLYKAAQPMLGDRTAWVAAALFAVNPWVIHVSRAAWVQALLPFFTAVIAWGLWPALATDRRSDRAMLVAGLAVTAMTQTYIAAWGVLTQLAALAPLARSRIPRRVLRISGLVFLAGVLLFAVGLSTAWSQNRQQLAGVASPTTVRLTRDGLDHAFRFVTGEDYEAVWARSETAEYEVRHQFSLAAAQALKIALLAGLVIAAREVWRGTGRRRAAVLLLVWFGVPILLTTVALSRVHVHYLLLSLPAGHVLAAWGLVSLTGRRLGWLLVPLLVTVSLVFGLNVLRAEERVAANPARLDMDGWSLEAAARLGESIRDLLPSDGSPYPKRVVSPGSSPFVSGLSAAYLDLQNDLAYPNFVLLPGDGPLLYALFNAPMQNEVLGPQAEWFPERSLDYANGVHVDFARVAPYSREAALALPEVVVDWPSDAGLTMLGYRAPMAVVAGESIPVTVYWRVEELLPERAEWYPVFFYHLVDESEDRLVNVGEHGRWGYRWRAGDVYVERMEMTPPQDAAPGRYEIRISLFDPIHSRLFRLHTPDGLADVVPVPITIQQNP